MGQKVHPIALRIQSSYKNFDQAWYSKYFFSNLIALDLYFRKYINNFFQLLKLPTGRYSICYFPKTTKIYTFFCYPKHSRLLKSKIFHISSNLPTFHKKSRYLSKFFSSKALFHPTLFQKICQTPNCIPITVAKKTHFDKKVIVNFFTSITSIFHEKYQRNQEGTHKNILESFLANDSVNGFFDSRKNFQDSQYKFQYFLQENYKLKNRDFQNSKPLSCLPLDLNILNTFKNILRFSQVTNHHQSINVFPASLFETTKNRLKYTTHLENTLSKCLQSNIVLIPFQVQNEWQDAGYFAEEIVFLLERRLSFRQIKNKLLNQFKKNPWIQGAKITCSGRVGGKSKKAQRAKIESLKFGQTSLHVLSSRIDFATRTAYTSLGSTGIKVWICYK